jgi:hypothetical protein
MEITKKGSTKNLNQERLIATWLITSWQVEHMHRVSCKDGHEEFYLMNVEKGVDDRFLGKSWYEIIRSWHR